jgi:hypothetical protein
VFSMEKVKKIFATIALLVLGTVFLVKGIESWRDSRRLAAEGKTTEGKVVDDEIRRGRRGSRTYYLTVQFRTESNQSVTRKITVDSDTHQAGVSSGAVKVHYLPTAPEICQAGAQVETKWGMAAGGAAFLVMGIFLLRSFKQPGSRKELGIGQEKSLGTGATPLRNQLPSHQQPDQNQKAA